MPRSPAGNDPQESINTLCNSARTVAVFIPRTDAVYPSAAVSHRPVIVDQSLTEENPTQPGSESEPALQAQTQRRFWSVGRRPVPGGLWRKVVRVL